MPPSLALCLWLILLVVLLRFDPAKNTKTSPAVWVTVLWLFIVASRLPSQWLGGAAGSPEEGNPLDRTIFSLLIVLAIGILTSRSFKWSDLFLRNLALTGYLSFALLSVVWSDYSFVAFKRWFRDLGNYLVILVVLTDSNPLEALRGVFRRLCYVLIPLSVVLIKYYPGISRQYDSWTGVATDAGATTSKNMLGLVCLISGIFFFWDTVTRWSTRKERRTKRIIRVNVVFIAMTLWVLNVAKSTTSDVCLALGCLVIAAAHSEIFQRHPSILKMLPPAAFCLYLVLALGFGMNGELAGAVGKDPTLTDRTKIWGAVLSLHTNPLLGTGYESFWMGPRLELFSHRSGILGINEAHNGYLEVYLNLGVIGLFLLLGFLIASYRDICKKLKPFSSVASLALALWTIILFYSVTEAGFRSGLLWLTFLLGGIAVPGRALDRVYKVAALDNVGTTKKFPGLGFDISSSGIIDPLGHSSCENRSARFTAQELGHPRLRDQ